MKKQDLESLRVYEEMASIASRYGIQTEVQKIIKDAYEESHKNFEDAMKKLFPLKDDLDTLDELAEWLSQKPRNLAEQRYRQREKPGKKKKYSSIVERIKSFSEAVDKRLATESIAQRNARYIKRMDELIKSGKNQRAAANKVHGEETGAGRKPPAPETIRKIHNNHVAQP